MANFLPICLWVLKQEDSTLSGRVVNLMDGQGLTRFGLGQHANPQLPPDFYSMPAEQAQGVAESTYKQEYWDRFMGDELVDDGVASCLLSFAINDGVAREVKMLQTILKVTADGLMGPVTLQKANAWNQRLLAACLRESQASFYKQCVQDQPTDQRFLTGWLRRAYLAYPNL